MDIGDTLKQAVDTGAPFQVRVTPRASVNRVVVDADATGGPQIRVYVTTAPEAGKANAAVIKLLAKSLGIAKSSLCLIRGSTAKLKTFRIET